MTECIEQGCNGNARARGYCHRHYQRYLAAGGARKGVVKGSPLERFHQLYEKNEAGCWIWKGYVPESGTPVIGQGKKWSSAKRFYYEHVNGPVPKGKLLWSQCGNTLCVNPVHLAITKQNPAKQAKESAKQRRVECRLAKKAAKLAEVQARVEARETAKLERARLAAEKAAIRAARPKPAPRIPRCVKQAKEASIRPREPKLPRPPRKPKMPPPPLVAPEWTRRVAAEDWNYSFCAFLPRGEHTIIDVEIVDWFFQLKWYAYRKKGKNTDPYVTTSIKGRQIGLHRMLMNCPAGLFVDHVNHQPLDNRRSNLRIATHAQNCFNIRKTRFATSAYKGVTFCRSNGKWKAYIKPPHYPRQSRLVLGYFDLEQDAALAFNEAAKLYHGEFACLNRVDSSTAT